MDLRTEIKVYLCKFKVYYTPKMRWDSEEDEEET
jgi:hypothetical protein